MTRPRTNGTKPSESTIFAAKLLPERKDKFGPWTPPRMTVFVRIDLGNGPEWMAAGFLTTNRTSTHQ